MVAAGVFMMVRGAYAQTNVNAMQQVVVEGLRSSQEHGSFNAAAYGPNGSLYLLLDEGDGVRVLRSDGGAQSVLGQALVGSAGDSGVAMAVDPSGDVYVTGTTRSGMLSGTAGVAYPGVADSSTNSFVAKFDADLHLVWLTFLGAGRTGAASVAATADSVFVTGVTFNGAFPVTGGGIQQSAANGTSENGFVERFSAAGALIYATYLTGVGGSTVPTAIVADSGDDAYIAGATGASGFPTVKALQPRILTANGVTTSGFLAKLTPAGGGFGFSTFVAGSGITGMALDAATSSLLLTGSVALGQFPVATVAMPLSGAQYQTLLRVSEDGQSLLASVLLTAGSQSFVSAGANGDAWVTGTVGTPLFPGVTQPDYTGGDSFLLHVTAANAIDQTLRLGGVAKNSAGYAAMTSSVAAPAALGTTVAVPGSVTVSVSASLLGTERFDLPLAGVPTGVLPNSVRDVVPSGAACGTSSVCSGTGGLLTVVSTAAAAPGLSLSVDDLPNVTVRNVGSADATGVAVIPSGYTATSDCGSDLEPSSQCSVALAGSGPGSLTVSANHATASAILGAATAAADALVLSTDELDFGIVSAASGTATRTVTVTNLSAVNQTFSSVKDGGASRTSYTLAEAGSDCVSEGSSGVHVLAAGSVCHITLGLSASSVSSNDGPVRTAWQIASRDVVVTGFMQAAALSVSASEVDFGLQIAGGVRLPRYLYLSNNSTSGVVHAAAVLPTGSPFSVSDGCPSMLAAQSVCEIVLTYQGASATSSDAVTLSLDEGLSVLVTGETLPVASVSGSTANPNLAVSVTALEFATPVDVTGVSSETQAVTLTNQGVTGLTIAIASTGDFTLTNACPAVLAGGASCTVPVGFAPSLPGAREGLLSVTAGNGFAPAYVSLSGTGTAILPANNGVLDVGPTLVGVPVEAWYPVQQSFPSLTVASNSAAFGVVLVEDTGSGHGTVPPSEFGQSATRACSLCWLGVQFESAIAAAQSGELTLSSVAGGNPYLLTVNGSSQAVQGLVTTPASEEFGTVAVGSSSAAVTLALTNLLNPAAVATVQSVTVSGDFALAPNASGGPTCTGTLASTASCYVEVAFSPTSAGERNGTLTVVTSAGTATAMLTGYGASYGPAAMGLAMSPNALVFAEVPGGAATVQSLTLTNVGGSALSVGTITSSAPSFAVSSGCGSLGVGASCSVSVTFTPQSATAAATLSVPVTETVNGQVLNAVYAVALTGAYTTADAGLEIVSSDVNYGATAANELGGTREYTLNNLSAKAMNVTLQLPRQFPLASNAACGTLAAGSSCSFSVSFVPVTTGAATGTVFAEGTSTDGLSQAQTLAYMLGYGSGSGALTMTGELIPNAPLSFGEVTSGQTTQQAVTLTNSGSGTLTIRRVSSEPPFLAVTDCGSMLAAQASCTVTLTYAPINELATGSSTSGSRRDAGTLTIESDAATSPDFLSLSGLVLPVASSNPASSAVLSAYALSESALTFPNTQVGGASAAQTLTLTNTGTTTVHLLGLVTPADFTATTGCSAMLPGGSCSVSVAFTPESSDAATLRIGTLEIQTDATDALEFVSLLGSSSAAPITLSATALNFGSVATGTTGTESETLTNTSGAPVTLTGFSATGSYSVAVGTCPAVGGALAAGVSCTIVVTFTATGNGTLTGTLSLSTDATQLPLTVALSGTSVAAQLQVVPGALTFGSVAVGGSGQLNLTLTNVGTAALTGIAQALGGTNAGDFTVAVPCGVTTLAPGQGCTETVMFMPGAAGVRAGTLTVASSDPSGPTVVTLSGSGVAAAAGSFTLTVSGGSSATVTVSSGAAASYPLMVTPVNGYTGSVALTCVAITAGKYASCSLLSPLLTLGGTQSTTVTISTLSAGMFRGAIGAAAMMTAVGMLLWRRSGLRRMMLAGLLGTIVYAGAFGCGHGGGVATSGSNIAYTPAGTYQYQVTASSTSGTQVSSTVTLNLIVQ